MNPKDTMNWRPRNIERRLRCSRIAPESAFGLDELCWRLAALPETIKRPSAEEYALASDADAAAIVFKDQPGVEDATSDFPAHLGAGVSCSGKYHRPNAGSGIISQAEGGAGNIDVLARYRTNGYSPVARKLLLGEQAIKSNTVQKGDPIASLKKR